MVRRWTGVGAALALAAGGCGGSGSDVASPASARRCLQDAGYAAVQRPGSQLLQTTGQVDVVRGGFRAGVYFFDSEDAASRDAVALGRTLAATGGGMTVRRKTVVVGYARRPARAERDRLEACLER